MLKPRVLVTPTDAMLDTSLQIQLDGFPSHQSVLIRMRMRDRIGRRWESHATFVADEQGIINLQSQEPLSGTYAGTDPMGLIWSMTLLVEPETTGPLSQGMMPPLPMTLTAELDGRVVIEKSFERLSLAPNIERRAIREQGLVGTFFAPGDFNSYPGIILLGGSEGGLHELDAALLAAHGFAVLALAYFGMNGVSPTLTNIPLEYFRNAIDFLQSQPQVRSDRLGVMGGSRGGEAALLIGATFPAIGAVVSLVGSGVITQSIGDGTLLNCLRNPIPSSWSYQGEPLPFLPYTITHELERQVQVGEPVELSQVFLPSLTDQAAVDAATIPVERTKGAILLISGGDDRSWPSQILSEIAMQRLAHHHHSYLFSHLCYPQAGHLIAAPPYGPSTDLIVPGPGVMFIMGGTPKANASARADSWQKLLQFFEEHLAS